MALLDLILMSNFNLEENSNEDVINIIELIINQKLRN